MTLADRVGYGKFLYTVGKEYAEIFRGSVTGGAVLTGVASYLGMGKMGAVLLGAMLVPLFLLIAISAGFCVVRWRVIHATIEREWENNPFQRAQIDTLREIRDELRAPHWPTIAQEFRVQRAVADEQNRRWNRSTMEVR